MNEEELKKIIAKSKLETSNSFMDHLMDKVEEASKRDVTQVFEISSKRLIAKCGLLIVIISFLAYYFLNGNYTLLDTIGRSWVTPLFVMGFGALLFMMNYFIRTLELSKSR